MKKRRLPCLMLLLAVGVVLCGIGIAGGWLLYRLPDRAAQKFGPPATGLDRLQLTLLSARMLLRADDLLLPANPGGSQQSFQIGLGESIPSIALRLQQAGLIHDPEALRNYLVYAGLDTTLQAGEYQLSANMTPLEIAHALQDATPSQVAFNLLPGWRLDEIAATLPTSGLEITPAQFRQAVASRPGGYSFMTMLPPQSTLEGFLFPGTYQLPRDLSADDLVRKLLDNFESQVNGDLRQGFTRQGLNLYQAVTLASMVQREAVVEEEMPLIASVFLNRLNAGLKLDSDPTVQYALGFNQAQQSWWTNPLSLDDLKIDSPFNTYLYAGLPPGPIANPGLAALQAVAFPAQTPYFYFRAACDGSGKHVFSQTFEEHASKNCP